MAMSVKILGLNCGTSVDAIDVAYCEIGAASSTDGTDTLSLRLIGYSEVAMDPALKVRVLQACRSNSVTMDEICDLNFALGEAFANAATVFMEERGLKAGVDVDMVGSHGQTLWHIPLPAEGGRKSTLQMAESAVIAHRTGLTTTSDFRVADVAAGRQGAPLVAFLDAAVLVHPTKLVASQNLGGIGNVAVIYPESEGGVDKCFEFDTGPANCLIDAAVRIVTDGKMEYDKDGELGSQGTVHQPTVDTALSHPYFSRALPKTTGREVFGDEMAASLVASLRELGLSSESIVATITRITAQSVVLAYERYLPKGRSIDELYMCGGGAFNPNIVDYLKEQMPRTRIGMLDEMGVPAAAKEAISFALLGRECITGRGVIVPDHVESPHMEVLGKITPGKNYAQLMQRLFSGAAQGIGSSEEGRPLYAKRIEVVPPGGAGSPPPLPQ